MGVRRKRAGLKCFTIMVAQSASLFCVCEAGLLCRTGNKAGYMQTERLKPLFPLIIRVLTKEKGIDIVVLDMLLLDIRRGNILWGHFK